MDNLTLRLDDDFVPGDREHRDDETRQDVVQYSNPWIGVKNFGDKGRGVVALRDIPVGAVIERCPVLIIPEPDRKKTDRTVVFTYVYMWEHGTTEQDLYTGKGRAAVALGMSSLLNHAPTPNATFLRLIDDCELELRSCRPIAAGDEITIDYQMKLWFDPS
jgi:SET domain-containing protein